MSASAKKAVRNAAWAVRALARYGVPSRLFYHAGGLGDELICTAVYRELVKRGHPPVTVMSNHPELFACNPDVRQVIPHDWRWPTLMRFFKRQSLGFSYGLGFILEEEKWIVPEYHMIARLCEVAGIVGEVAIRPYLTLTDLERQKGRVADRQIAIMSSGMQARFQQRNKQWFPERFQSVVSQLRHQFQFVQVGQAGDPLLDGVIDLRGKTSLRESAAILANSMAFVGQIGLLMHLARSVDCPSVIVYGGLERPDQSGYTANINLYTPLPCSPCWRANLCDFERKCMSVISANEVIEAVQALIVSRPQTHALTICTVPVLQTRSLLEASPVQQVR